MKHKLLVQHLISALFAFLLGISAVGSLATGYALPVESLWKIYLWCGIFALLTSLLLHFRHGGHVLAVFGAIMLWVLWQRETLWQQTRLLSYIITTQYHIVYGWPVFGTPEATDVSLPLLLWATLTAGGVNWQICRGKHILFAMVPAVLPLVLCFITTDMVPDGIYLYLLITVLAVLLITDWTRRKNPAQGMKLLFRVSLPVAVFLGLIFLLNPRGTYISKAGELQKEALSWLQDTSQAIGERVAIDAAVSEKLNLRAIGPKNDISYAVMRVNAPVSETVYLRGRDYDQYTGTGWEATPDREEVFKSVSSSKGALTVLTYGVRDVQYVPYYAAGEIRLKGGACENSENLQRYGFSLTGGAAGRPDPRYTELPDATYQWAAELVKNITGDVSSEGEMLLRIQNYVLTSATYDRGTASMDSGADDFAEWFLTKSETGYCVHFATAATVLLRAAEIPARYVEGYMVNCTAGADVLVSNQAAHAWAEYYDADSGMWRVLEATPADPEREENTPVELPPETQTVPIETEPEQSDLPAQPTIQQEKAPEATNVPTDDAPEQTTVQFKVPDWLKGIFKGLLFMTCIPLQAHIRIYRKRVLWSSGRPNDRTLARWQQTRTLGKLLKQPYPEYLEATAQKAKFSQHKIHPEELQQYEDYRLSLLQLLQGKPWYLRQIFRWLLAIA